jgi:hypothetical protein
MSNPNPIPGIPPNMSLLAALSAGLISANTQITNAGIGEPNPTIMRNLSKAHLAANLAESSLTLVTPSPIYGGT